MSYADGVIAARERLATRRALLGIVGGGVIVWGTPELVPAWPVLSMAARLVAAAVAVAVSLKLPPARQWTERIEVLNAELAALRGVVEARGAAYPTRGKGEMFKAAYQLRGRALDSLEEALGVGMFREGREVFVTAFMREGVAVRVTAAVGTPSACRPADRPEGWPRHFRRLGCDEIRQYHNHPGTSGATAPSGNDRQTCIQLEHVLGELAPQLRSFIVYWNEAHEWKVLEYDARGAGKVVVEFDARAALMAGQSVAEAKG
ncbi:hypothetical protein [Luteitalea sp.]|uniref:hypothetical protein n=1 Tax=Luteitalea sp. TaxID=2004800 RepID=UPI0025BF53CB|nr:hypothetical protein [Luteitalea sp.]